MRKLWSMLLLWFLLPGIALAAEARVVDTLQGPDYTVLLTEEADGRYVSVLTAERVLRSGPWPGDTIFYGVPHDGSIELLWDERIAWYSLCPDGEWRLSGLHDYGVDFWATAAPWGLYDNHEDRFIVGNCAVPLSCGPVGDQLYAMADSPDRTGLAVVQADSAPLHATPAGEMLGSFFAGTPVKVLQAQGEWLQVAVAADDRLTGWMQSAHLATGNEISSVIQASIRFTLPESEWDCMPWSPPYCTIGVQGPFLILWTDEGVQHAVYSSLNGRDAPLLSHGRLRLHNTDVLLALTEDGENRQLWVCETDDTGRTVIRSTRPLPRDVTLHPADKAFALHELTLSWNSGSCQATFDRRSDGTWLLSAISCQNGSAHINRSVAFCGLLTGAGRPVPGSFNGVSQGLFDINLATLFGQLSMQGQHGWAVVESFMAEVYTDREAAEAGLEYRFRLWQGTPLRILQEEGGLCQVALGDGGLTGWVYASRLAVGEELLQSAFLPDLTIMPDTPLTADRPLDLQVSPECIWPVGEMADGSLAIILLPDGSVGYCPSGAIQHGNG